MSTRAQASAPLLGIIAVLATLAALAAHAWATQQTTQPVLQVLPAAAAYSAATRLIAALTDVDPRHALTGSLHLIATLPIALLVLLALLVGTGEDRYGIAHRQPAWGVLLARAAHHSLTTRTPRTA